MGFYDLSEEKRKRLVETVEKDIRESIENDTPQKLHRYFSDEDTYIRRTAYLATGKLYFSKEFLHEKILQILHRLFSNPHENVRQTVVNALGEIGKKEAEKALPLFEKAMIDEHHSVRNAVIGSLKKMGEKNPTPVLAFSKKFLHHSDPEIRRQAVHGIELRGRTHPEDILPLLEELQFEQNRRVIEIVIHVLGQISYKKGCLKKVIAALRKWKNKEIVKVALEEILETHKSFEKFSAKSFTEAKDYIQRNI